jgi:hypothetical protein
VQKETRAKAGSYVLPFMKVVTLNYAATKPIAEPNSHTAAGTGTGATAAKNISKYFHHLRLI